MSFDALLKALPGSPPWLVVILLLIIATFLIERIVGLTTSFTARRSDQQLLDHAEKAVSILGKLPDDHSSRQELLVYIAKGPVAELAERQNSRISRKEATYERKRQRANALGAAAMSAVLYIFVLPVIVGAIDRAASDTGIPDFYKYFAIAVGLFLLILPIMIVGLITYFSMELVNLFEQSLGNLVIRTRKRRIKKKQDRLGIGGVYEI